MALINKNFPIYIQVKRTAFVPKTIRDMYGSLSGTTKVCMIDGGVLVTNDGESVEIQGGIQDTRIVGKFTDQNLFLLAMGEIIEYYKKKGVSELSQITAYADMSDGSNIDVIYDVEGRKFFHKDDLGSDGKFRENDDSKSGKKLYQIKSIGGLLNHVADEFGEYCATFNLFVQYVFEDGPSTIGATKYRLDSIIEISCSAENKNPEALEGTDIGMDSINKVYDNLTFKDNYLAREFLHEMNQAPKNVITRFDDKRAEYFKRKRK